MCKIRTQLESILLQRIADAMSGLPDGGRRPTAEREATVERIVTEFVHDVKRVANVEIRQQFLQ